MGCITFGYNPFLMSGVVNAVTRVVTGGLSITNIAIFVIKDYRDSLYYIKQGKYNRGYIPGR